jgi:hypothetical protein
MRLKSLMCIASALACLSAPTLRAEDMVTSVTIDQVATILKDSGYRAEIVQDKSMSAGA